MKTFGKILFGIVVILVGLRLYSCSYAGAFNKYISEEGDKAIVNDDLSFFKNRFEVYLKTPLIEETITLNDDVSFNLHIYQQAYQNDNFLTVLVDNLSIEKASNTLDLTIVSTIGGTRKFEMLRIGKENWYLQWVQLFLDEIKEIKIAHGDDILYHYDDEAGFLGASDFDLAALAAGENSINGVITKTTNNPVDPNFTDASVGEEKEYEVRLNFAFADKDLEDELYLSGNFNNWQENDNDYLLKKDKKTGYYTAKIKIKTDYEALVFKLLTKSGKTITDKDNNIIYYTKELIDEENFDLANYNIEKSEKLNFSKYSYYSWIALGAYILVIGVVSYLLFFRQGKKPKAVYTKEQPPKQKPQEPQQNLNIKAIEEIKERDDSYKPSDAEEEK